MPALGHVWTAPPWQELSELLQHCRVRSCVRPVCAAVKPLAIMLCADRVPIVSPHFKPKRALPIPGSTLSALRRYVLADSFRTSNTVVVAWPHLLKSLGFDATSL